MTLRPIGVEQVDPTDGVSRPGLTLSGLSADHPLAFAIDDGINRLGLHEWDIVVRLRDEIDGGTSNALCGTTPCCRSATIEIERDTNPATYRVLALHELLHVVLADIDHTVEKRLVDLIPEPLRPHATELYTDAMELTVHRLAHALAGETDQ